MGRGGHRSHGSGRARPGFQEMMDHIADNKIPITIINGCYTLSSNQTTAMMQLDNIEKVVNGNTQPGTAPSAPVQIYQTKMHVVGNKTKRSNQCCMWFTIMFGCLIFPIFFMFCAWWKKLVHPHYEMNIEFYRSIGRFLRTCTTCIALTVTVVDNAFDKQRADILYESIQGTQLRSFTFENKAIAIDYNNDQPSNYLQNMGLFKQLPLQTTIIWGEKRM